MAIARALANDPDIILADEPTGALDSVTSEQIMDLIKEISAGKLVIMVTHNPELAEKYADRIVRFKDGKVMSDSSPCEQTGEDAEYSLKKTSMSFFTALNLSGRNIATKKWRTALTSFAASIGIIGIARPCPSVRISARISSRMARPAASSAAEFTRRPLDRAFVEEDRRA